MSRKLICVSFTRTQFPQRPPQEATKPVRNLRINQPARSNGAPRARPCGPRAGLLLPQRPPLAHRAEFQSRSGGFAAPRRGLVPGFSGRTPRCRSALGSAPQPRARGEARALASSCSHTNSTRETFRSRGAADSAPCSPPARRAAAPASPSRTASAAHPPRPQRPPAARPRVSARHPAARASRPSPRPAHAHRS